MHTHIPQMMREKTGNPICHRDPTAPLPIATVAMIIRPMITATIACHTDMFIATREEPI
jgi:hypothetical protein